MSCSGSQVLVQGNLTIGATTITITRDTTILVRGDFTASEGTTLVFEAGSSIGLISIQGKLHADGTLEFVFSDTPPAGTVYTVFTFTGTLTGNFVLKTTFNSRKRQSTTDCVNMVEEIDLRAVPRTYKARVVSCNTSPAGLSGGAIAGIVIGGTAFLVIVFIIAYFLVRKGRSKKHLDVGDDIQLKEKKPTKNVVVETPVRLKDDDDTSSSDDTSDDDSTSNEGTTSSEQNTSKQDSTDETTDSSSGSEDSDSDSDSETESSTSTSRSSK